jgi:hypothetical protein
MVEEFPPGHPRRRRLFGVACARQVWDLLSTDTRSAVLISERLADGRATDADLRAAAVQIPFGGITYQQHAHIAAGYASAAFYFHPPAEVNAQTMWNVHDAARNAAKAIATRVTGRAPPGQPTPQWHAAWTAAYNAARAEQADLVRDVFPPPGTSPAVEPGWLTSTVVALARRVYESRDFSPMPILADALQDAGCADELVLGHCRKTAPHVRGCWVVDLVLGM